MNSLNIYGRTQSRGFTVVELLIVIVVIAILAAISIAVYMNVQNSANDSVVKRDLASVAQSIRLSYVEEGAYPTGGMVYVDSTTAASGSLLVNAPSPDVGFVISKGSWSEPQTNGSANFMYCTGPDVTSGQQEFNILGGSKSGKVFRYSSAYGIVDAGTGTTSSSACDKISYPRSASYGYSKNAGGWQSWVK